MTETRQLPNDWTTASVVDLLVDNSNGKPFQQGFSPKCETRRASREEWGVLKTTAIQENDFWPHENKKLPASIPPRPNLEVAAGDILMTCAGPRSRCGVACFVKHSRPRLLLSGKMYRFRTNAEIMEAKFLMHYLATREAWGQIDRMKTGISDSGLNLTHDRFAKLLVPVAPLHEQRRIVEKIETLFARLDKGEEALREVQKLLSRYRQSVLKAAVTGQITADWRAKNAHRLEHGRDLLARILQTRRETWEGRGKYKEPAVADTADLPKLPKRWEWVSLGSLITSGPQNGLYLPQSKYGSGTPILRIDDYQLDWIRPRSGLRLVAADTADQKKYSLRQGDFVLGSGLID